MSSTTATFSASAYRMAGQSAAARIAANRSAEWEARKAEQAAKQEQIRQKRDALAYYLFDQLPRPEDIEKLPILHGSTMITIARPPAKEDVDVEVDGVVQSMRVPKYPSEQTHFAGYCRETRTLANAEQDGLPLVALYQGFRSKSADGQLGDADPKTLPDGLTAVDKLNAMLIQMLPEGEDPESVPCARLLWNPRPRGPDGVEEDARLEIRLVWDLKAWDTWIDKRNQRARERGRGDRGERGRGGRGERGRGDREGRRGGLITLDEHVARQESKRSFRPRTPPGPPPEKEGETTIPVRGRRRAGRGPVPEQ